MQPHLGAALEENYRRFVERVLEGGEVWSLKCDDGLLTCVSENGEHPVIPFWSDAAYARTAAEEAPEDDGYVVDSLPLRTFLQDILGNFQRDDVFVGPNYTRDMAGLELDPRDVFEEFRSRMSAKQRAEYKECFEAASILVVGHPSAKLEERIKRFARIVAFEGNVAYTLVRGEGPIQVDVRARPGASFVPLWSSGKQAEQARSFVFGSDEGITVAPVDVDELLKTAGNEGWSIGVEPTVGLACFEKSPGDLLALVAKAAAEAEAEAKADD